MSRPIVCGQIWQIRCRLLVPSEFSRKLLYAVLVESGFKPQEIVEEVTAQHQEIAFFPTSEALAKRILAKIKSLNLKNVRVSLKLLKKSDWQDRWKKGVKPFALTKTIDVVPRWSNVPYRKRAKFSVFIDTNLAFGTGLHETTRFMAELIESCRGSFSTFLDVGTGTGILVVVASFCGAKNLSAIDIDPQSIATAKTNLLANHILNAKLLRADLSKWQHKGNYDFVAANLVTEDLVSFGKKLAALVAPQKYLAVSGISIKNLPRLQKSFGMLPLKKIKVLRGKQWAAMLYKKL